MNRNDPVYSFNPPAKIRRFFQEEEEEEEVLSTSTSSLFFSSTESFGFTFTLVFFSSNNTKERNPLFLLLLVSSPEKSFRRNPRSSRTMEEYLSRFRGKEGRNRYHSAKQFSKWRNFSDAIRSS